MAESQTPKEPGWYPPPGMKNDMFWDGQEWRATPPRGWKWDGQQWTGETRPKPTGEWNSVALGLLGILVVVLLIFGGMVLFILLSLGWL